MDDELTPVQAVDHLIDRGCEIIPGLRASHLAMEMATPLGEVIPEGADGPTLLRVALVEGGTCPDAIAAIALAARMRIEAEREERTWIDAAGAPSPTDAEMERMSAEAERDRRNASAEDRAAGAALATLRTDWEHLTDAAAAIASVSPGEHASILARLLARADDDGTLMAIGANWLAGAAGEQGFGDGGDAPEPEPGPRPPGLSRPIRRLQDA